MSRITVREVAREAGVSVGSVSRVLNRLPVSENLRTRVYQAIETLGYQPNALARGMRTRSTGVIGCLVPNIANPLYATVVNAIETRLRREGYLLLLGNAMNDPVLELSVLDAFRQRQVDGLIVAPATETDSGLVQALRRVAVPMVVLNRDYPTAYSSVLTDHRSGVRGAVRYLIGLGHRRIALLCPGENVRPGRERITGLREAFAEAGLPEENAIVRPQRTSVDFAYGDVQELLASRAVPTAFLALGTQILAGTLKAIRDRGLRVPDNVSVISLGDADLAAVHNPPITTLRWRDDEFGQAAVELLLEQLAGKGGVAPRNIALETELVLRGSCAPPPVRVADAVSERTQADRTPEQESS